MAASLSRPDPSSPASVAEAAFSTARRGFNVDEVRAFLVSVAAELGRLTERERQLEAELREARAISPVAELDDETVANLLGEETLRVLHTARESASQIRIRAEENAARLVREATDEANRVRQEIEIEAARRRQDAQSDAEAEVALAKQQGREMVNEARAYRERVLADLERRTTLARQQIEELIHGRDRLLQVFERARLVAVDVTAGLAAVDEPDELVNLTPTTGPVPVMVPNQARPGSAADDEATDAEPEPEVAQPEPSEPDEAPPEVAVDQADEEADEEVDEEVDEGEPDGETAEASDEAEAVETSVDDTSDETAADTAEPAAAGGDNVVSLFGDRVPAHEAATADEHPSVDDIFERLRHQTEDEVDDGDDAVDGERAVAAGESMPLGEHPAGDDSVETEDHDDGTDDDDVSEPTVFGRRDEVLVPLIVAGARRLKRVLADEQNEALDMLRQGDSVISLDSIVPLLDEHVETYVAALADELAQAAAAGATEVGARNTKALRKQLVDADALGRANDQVRQALVGPLRDRLDRAIADGSADNDDITRRVRAVYREWKTQHIDTELDDVFRYAFSAGLATAIEPGTPHVWTVDPSVVACPDCEDNSLAGSVPAGEAFPTGHRAAPGHPGCRCLALPTR
jgi:DivIVA domain-containing protein